MIVGLGKLQRGFFTGKRSSSVPGQIASQYPEFIDRAVPIAQNLQGIVEGAARPGGMGMKASPFIE
jgi:hypothetical protein